MRHRQIPSLSGGRMGGMAVAVDVGYPASGGARAAAVMADDPAFDIVRAEHVVTLDAVAPYRPGRFFERELPAIRAVLAVLAGGPDLDLVVVDGYVNLDPEGRAGLGAYVRDEFGVPVIGVAKTPFRTADHAVPVLRGGATRPLLVTAAGIEVGQAAALVRAMAGPYRLPDALRRVDALSRGAEPVASAGP